MSERKVPPTHPGVVLAEALDSMGLKIMPAAKLLGTSGQTLHKILRGDGPISPTMAPKTGAHCGTGPNLWLGMQINHDLWHEARNIKREIAAIEKAAAA